MLRDRGEDGDYFKNSRERKFNIGYARLNEAARRLKRAGMKNTPAFTSRSLGSVAR